MNRSQIESMFKDVTRALAIAREINEGARLLPHLMRVQALLMDRIWQEDLANDRAEAAEARFLRDRDEMFAVK